MPRRLTLLTFLVLVLSSVTAVQAQTPPQDPVAGWTFNDPQDGAVVETRSGERTAIESPFHPAEWVDGASGRGFRTDGYSTWLATDVPSERQPKEALTIEAWVALESYPVSNAPIVNQYTFPTSGFFFGMDPWGQWYLAVSIDGEWYTCWAENPFPKQRWVHVAGTFDSESGEMTVYLDGEVVGTASVPAAALTVDTETRLTVGRDVHSPTIADFETGLLNGILDEVFVYDRALSDADVQQRAQSVAPPASPNLDVPDSRFASDLHRPQVHAMPPANWTNEPHGLVLHNGTYHMFHQRNPNGPYFQRLRWGHMTSDDLVNWTNEPVAMWPEPGWDEFGAWSGDAVSDGDTLTLVYTGADRVKAGIGIARQQGDGSFRKAADNPVIPAAPERTRDFRDPYVFQEDGTWHALIGSGFEGAGGAALHYTSSNLQTWTYEGPAFQAPKSLAGVFWEMPVLVHLGDDKYVFEITTVEEDAPARGLYWIGTWDGAHFTPDHPEPRPLDLVNHLLSPTVTRDREGRSIAIGIVPDTRSTDAAREAGWVHTFSLPREWRLCDGDLCQSAAPQTKTLRGPHLAREGIRLGPNTATMLDGVEGKQLEIRATFDPGGASQWGIMVRTDPARREQTKIYYDQNEQAFKVDLRQSTQGTDVRNTNLHVAPYARDGDEPMTLHVFVDHSILDVFVDDRKAFSTRIYPSLEASTGVALFAEGGAAEAEAERVDVWRLGTDEPFPEPSEPTGDASDVRLLPNVPNPVHGSTAISFALAAPQQATLTVHDQLGRRVETLVDRHVETGTKTVRWTPPEAMASGVYFYKLRTDEATQARKLVLVR